VVVWRRKKSERYTFATEGEKKNLNRVAKKKKPSGDDVRVNVSKRGRDN